jgi:hypothetical protein
LIADESLPLSVVDVDPRWYRTEAMVEIIPDHPLVCCSCCSIER